MLFRSLNRLALMVEMVNIIVVEIMKMVVVILPVCVLHFLYFEQEELFYLVDP